MHQKYALEIAFQNIWGKYVKIWYQNICYG